MARACVVSAFLRRQGFKRATATTPGYEVMQSVYGFVTAIYKIPNERYLLDSPADGPAAATRREQRRANLEAYGKALQKRYHVRVEALMEGRIPPSLLVSDLPEPGDSPGE